MSRRHASNSSPRRSARAAGVAIALVAVLGALVPSAAVAQSGASDPRQLETQWQLLEYRDSTGNLQPVPPGISVIFLARGGRIRGTAACGSYDAAYTATDSGSINIDLQEVDPLACDPGAQAVDDAFYEALQGAAGWSVDSNVSSILQIDDQIEEPLMRLTSARIPLDPTIATWKLARLGRADGSIETVAGVAPVMQFLRGGGSDGRLSGRVVGSTGCGSFLGSYQTNLSSMRITPVIPEEGADSATGVNLRLADNCTETQARQAEEFVATLEEITDFSVLPAGLTLESNDTARLALSPEIDLGDRSWTPTEILASTGEPRQELSDQLSTSLVQFFGGSAEGLTKCRAFDGKSLASGLALSTSALTPADVKCSTKSKGDTPSAADVEAAFLRALRLTASHALRGDELELLDRDSTPLMRLTPQADLVGPTWVLWKMDTVPRNKRKGETEFPPDKPTPITAVFADLGGSGVVRGDTGAAAKGRTPNSYVANADTSLGAGQIDITVTSVNGEACPSNKKKPKPMCRQQADYLRLLDAANGVIVREGDLQLTLDGEWVLRFLIEQPDTLDG